MTLKELHCLIEAEKQKEKVSDEVIKAAAALLKDHCSKMQYCSLCLFRVEYPDQGGGSYCGCKLEHGTADFSMKCRPADWEV